MVGTDGPGSHLCPEWVIHWCPPQGSGDPSEETLGPGGQERDPGGQERGPGMAVPVLPALLTRVCVM